MNIWRRKNLQWIYIRVYNQLLYSVETLELIYVYAFGDRVMMTIRFLSIFIGYTSCKLTDNSWVKHTRKYGFDFKAEIIHQIFHIHRIYIRTTVDWEKGCLTDEKQEICQCPQRRELWTRALSCCCFVFSWLQMALGSPIPCLVWQKECVGGKSTHWHLIAAPVQQSHRADICPSARGANVKKAKVWRRRAFFFLTELKSTCSPVP